MLGQAAALQGMHGACRAVGTACNIALVIQQELHTNVLLYTCLAVDLVHLSLQPLANHLCPFVPVPAYHQKHRLWLARCYKQL